MQSFDFNSNVRRVSAFERPLRVAYALLCAGRLLPMCRAYAQNSDLGDPDRVEALYNRLWLHVLGSSMASGEAESAAEEAEALVPSADDGWDEATQAYAEDAVAALAYALRACISDDPREAAWAGLRVYEAADQFSLKTLEGHAGSPEYELAALSSPIVQRELLNQQVDLDELDQVQKLPSLSDRGQALSVMRARSERQAQSFFS